MITGARFRRAAPYGGAVVRACGAGEEQRGPRTAAEATAALADVPASELRRSLLRWGRTLEPFWLRAVDVIGAHAGYAPHLHERYRESASGASP